MKSSLYNVHAMFVYSKHKNLGKWCSSYLPAYLCSGR